MTRPASDSSLDAEGAPEAKTALRSQMLAARKAMRAAEPDAPSNLTAQIVRTLDTIETLVIAGYVAIGDELDPSLALEALQNAGASIVLPVAGKSGDVLAFRAWQTGDAMEKGRLSTYHPAAKSEAIDPDVILVPLVAFDTFGYRLGFGGGYYDRTLPKLRAQKNIVAYGIGYDDQEVSRIPRESFDAQLDGVITPSRFIPVQTDG
ncbi:MAG: 5-formyltetrahydrofolate cyclo-ligase [Rhodospirillaceae bacterium]|jgi:5-formyltetrahydrofolate cyclo-ligase|nr:5-formyltetrahydrofolate cyclo-ligase [Rhodospirillaceae bacterium]MBT5565531.1 5-formyltetrahydrofolate cyclo-ligase [Rhodospirillaceae bacterium]MBT6089861.1 5-formyltetrahydrofolate cyclo-ligase [Rhodospirillaceae bacterium]MBT6962044.1 5-formyltetrahydrofolate cyclo-ligase [Rhodospirillaceae bacterium]